MKKITLEQLQGYFEEKLSVRWNFVPIKSVEELKERFINEVKNKNIADFRISVTKEREITEDEINLTELVESSLFCTDYNFDILKRGQDFNIFEEIAESAKAILKKHNVKTYKRKVDVWKESFNIYDIVKDVYSEYLKENNFL